MSDWKLVTLRLSADEEGGYHLPGGSVACFGGQHWLRGGPHVVSVEPAPRLLPTELGSLILARAGAIAMPVTLELRQINGSVGWLCAGVGYIEADRIQSGWVQIHQGTLRPVEEES